MSRRIMLCFEYDFCMLLFTQFKMKTPSILDENSVVGAEIRCSNQSML